MADAPTGVERALVQQNLDAWNLAQALSRRYGDQVGHRNWNEKVVPPWPARKGLGGADSVVEPLVRALPVMLEFYRTAKDEPRFQAKDLRLRG